MFNVFTVFRQPDCVLDQIRSQFNTFLAGFEAFMIDLAGAVDNVEITTRDRGGVDGAVILNYFIEAALTATSADFFPLLFFGGCHNRKITPNAREQR